MALCRGRVSPAFTSARLLRYQERASHMLFFLTASGKKNVSWRGEKTTPRCDLRSHFTRKVTASPGRWRHVRPPLSRVWTLRITVPLSREREETLWREGPAVNSPFGMLMRKSTGGKLQSRAMRGRLRSVRNKRPSTRRPREMTLVRKLAFGERQPWQFWTSITMKCAAIYNHRRARMFLVCVHVPTYAHAYLHIYTDKHTCRHIQIYTSIHTFTHIYILTNMHPYMNRNIHTYIHNSTPRPCLPVSECKRCVQTCSLYSR